MRTTDDAPSRGLKYFVRLGRIGVVYRLFSGNAGDMKVQAGLLELRMAVRAISRGRNDFGGRPGDTEFVLWRTRGAIVKGLGR
jgi:hypothetical protein